MRTFTPIFHRKLLIYMLFPGKRYLLLTASSRNWVGLL